MDCKVIIFDLDGTLLDTLADLAAAGNRVLEEAGLPVHPVDSYRYFVGDGLATLVARILPEEMRSEEEFVRMAAAFKKVYATKWNATTRPYEGVDVLLNGLQERNVSLNVLSNKPDEFTRICVQEFLADWSFDQVLGNREGLPRKPDPTGALEIAARLKVNPSQIAYLGDTATDMQTATAAGMYPLGALWGFRTAEELQESGAARLVSSPEEVLTLFG